MRLKHGDLAARKVSERIAAAEATTTTLKAIPVDCRTDGMMCGVLADQSVWIFDADSTESASASCLVPTLGTGRWLLIGGIGGGSGALRPVRGVVHANIADLTAFTVASNDGLTYVEGERVALVGQTTAAQCGLYVVGAVATGVAPLTRADDFPLGAAVLNGCTFEVSEGTIWAGSSWKAMCTGAKVVGTHDPLFYPRKCKGQLTLASGTKTLGSTEGLFLFSVTKSQWTTQFVDQGGTKTGTIGFKVASAGRTAGKSGTGAATVIAHVEAGTIQNLDNSVVDWTVTNW